MVPPVERKRIPGLMQDGTFHCANCGAGLPRRFQHSRMVVCPNCGSTSILRDGAFEHAGSGGIMLDAPSLVGIGAGIRVGNRVVTPVGHARFSYGRGWWDEYWCPTGTGETGYWLSVDEGDYAVERPLPEDEWPRARNLTLGQTLTVAGVKFTVTEAENATCLAVRGEFPEELEVGETHLYFDLSGPGGEMATYEVWDGGRGWTRGSWIDPWDVRAA